MPGIHVISAPDQPDRRSWWCKNAHELWRLPHVLCVHSVDSQILVDSGRPLPLADKGVQYTWNTRVMCVCTPLRLRELSAGSFPGRLTRGRSAHFARGERRIYVELRLISSSVNYINDEKVELTAFPLIFPSVFSLGFVDTWLCAMASWSADGNFVLYRGAPVRLQFGVRRGCLWLASVHRMYFT